MADQFIATLKLKATSNGHNWKRLSFSPTIIICDAVYRWVNPLSSKKGNKLEQIARYRDNNELRYSMRSFAQVEGIRHFHIVAKGPPPIWLNTSHRRIFYHNETRLLDELRVARGIQSPLAVYNSEPAKLAIARIPDLAERFLLVDDDYYIIPQPPPAILSTRLFFDDKGVPLHPDYLVNAHRPLPFLRDVYVKAANGEPTSMVEMILRSKANREVMSIDRMPHWAQKMRRKGTARATKVTVRAPMSILFCCKHADHHHNGTGTVDAAYAPCYCNGTLLHAPKGVASNFSSKFTLYWLSAHSEQQKSWHPDAEGGLPLTKKRVSKFYHGEGVRRFFELVAVVRPLFVCVNDHWPLGQMAYQRAIAPFREFVEAMYPRREGWEVADL